MQGDNPFSPPIDSFHLNPSNLLKTVGGVAFAAGSLPFATASTGSNNSNSTTDVSPHLPTTLATMSTSLASQWSAPSASATELAKSFVAGEVPSHVIDMEKRNGGRSGGKKGGGKTGSSSSNKGPKRGKTEKGDACDIVDDITQYVNGTVTTQKCIPNGAISNNPKAAALAIGAAVLAATANSL